MCLLLACRVRQDTGVLDFHDIGTLDVHLVTDNRAHFMVSVFCGWTAMQLTNRLGVSFLHRASLRPSVAMESGIRAGQHGDYFPPSEVQSLTLSIVSPWEQYPPTGHFSRANALVPWPARYAF